MDLIRAHRVLEMVARKYGVTVDEVVENIEKGINEAIEVAIKDNNIEALNEWRRIPCAGSRPTAAELVAYIGERLMSDMNDYFSETTILS